MQPVENSPTSGLFSTSASPESELLPRFVRNLDGAFSNSSDQSMQFHSSLRPYEGRPLLWGKRSPAPIRVLPARPSLPIQWLKGFLFVSRPQRCQYDRLRFLELFPYHLRFDLRPQFCAHP